MAAVQPAGLGFPTLDQIRANPVRGKKGQTPTNVLALDLSSTCVGWALGSDRKLARHGKLVFKSTAGVGEKLVSFHDYLGGLIDVYEPVLLLSERPLSRRGNTTGRHFELLGIARKLWRDVTGLEMEDEHLISARTVKNALGVKPGRNHDHNKQIMVEKINDLYGLRLKYDKNSKYKTDDDTADAIAVLTAYYRRHKE